MWVWVLLDRPSGKEDACVVREREPARTYKPCWSLIRGTENPNGPCCLWNWCCGCPAAARSLPAFLLRSPPPTCTLLPTHTNWRRITWQSSARLSLIILCSTVSKTISLFFTFPPAAYVPIESLKGFLPQMEMGLWQAQVFLWIRVQRNSLFLPSYCAPCCPPRLTEHSSRAGEAMPAFWQCWKPASSLKVSVFYFAALKGASGCADRAR